MKPQQRQAAIVHYLQEHGTCSVEQLATHFNLTATTIRKDLTLLAKHGGVIRTYGGVVLTRDEVDPPIDHKTLINSRQKQLIARYAARLINDGDSIIIDAGSTVLEMVPYLNTFNTLTIMTNGLHIVNALSELESELTILMPGGTLRKKSGSFHGQLAENAFSYFSFDRLFMGADGIDIDVGVTTFNEVFTVSRAMCNAARQVVLVADSSKFGRKSPNVVCPLTEIDVLISDEGLSEEYRQRLAASGIQVIIAREMG